MLFFDNWSAMQSACLIASVTMVSVGFSAPPSYSAAAGSIIGSAICGKASERWR